MDCMGFGMGCSCLQVTFQACNIEEARTLYDQLTPLCPILLALTAASPIYRGFVSDLDTRWTPLEKEKFVINKSRYDSIDSYLSCDIYSDIDLNIQSTNWQTMRFKPPPPKSNIGWRVEFRPMEVQLTDFENAAYTTFLVLMTRVILTFGLKFIIPLTKVDENLQRAFKRDAVLEQKFYFRKDILTDCSPPEAEECIIQCCDGRQCRLQDQYTEMTINDIIHGKDDFPGLIPLIEHYLEMEEIDIDTSCTLKQYLNFISARASGKLKTTARWMRDFVTSHPDYKQDSVVTETINYDLLMKCAKISEEQFTNEHFQADTDKLLPPVVETKTSDEIPQAVLKQQELINKKVARNGTLMNGN
ncbi:GSH1-like protein [Mya arenaria]|uniref:Glutamate--cysteine ligase n=1 Tax=Mya arenaria TaxID=6604 RepID=A0ABY7F4B8_MYAAR|nr:GSH1-like protein [Mya arenaria]